MNRKELKALLDKTVTIYNHPGFIKDDPVLIPHMFTRKQDIEIMGFFAAVFAWGQRATIINKCKELISRMDNDPYGFITGHEERDLKSLTGFKHRTFNDTDLLYFIHFFRHWYHHHPSLESAFTGKRQLKEPDVGNYLNHFRATFFTMEDVPGRTLKHIASPAQKSACKRINMFLRWMVRDDLCGVDLGIWKNISPSQLICPLDVHVQRVALKLGLLQRTQSDWQAAVELTRNLRAFDNTDPVKYDFALFGLGVSGEF